MEVSEITGFPLMNLFVSGSEIFAGINIIMLRFKASFKFHKFFSTKPFFPVSVESVLLFSSGRLLGRIQLPEDMRNDPNIMVCATKLHYLILIGGSHPNLLVVEKTDLSATRRHQIPDNSSVSIVLFQGPTDCVLGAILRADRGGFSKVLVRFRDSSASFREVFQMTMHSELACICGPSVCLHDARENDMMLVSHEDPGLLWRQSLPCGDDHGHLFSHHGSRMMIVCRRRVTLCSEEGDILRVQDFAQDFLYTGAIGQSLLDRRPSVVSASENGFVAVSTFASTRDHHLATINVFAADAESDEMVHLDCVSYSSDARRHAHPPSVRVAKITSGSAMYVRTNTCLHRYDLGAKDVRGSRAEVFSMLALQGDDEGVQEYHSWEDRFVAYICEGARQSKCYITIYDCQYRMTFLEH